MRWSTYGLHKLGKGVRAESNDEQDQRDTPPCMTGGLLHGTGAAGRLAGAAMRGERETQGNVADEQIDRAAADQANSPTRDTARSLTPDAPRSIDRVAASREDPAVLAGSSTFRNGRLAFANSMRRRPAPAVPNGGTPSPTRRGKVVCSGTTDVVCVVHDGGMFGYRAAAD
jgi:hypothetical protein